MLFQTPDLDLADDQVISEIQEIRAALATFLRAPRRWGGSLRRTAQARAIQGSNTIEGYTVSDQDAVAAVEDEAPLTADQQTWAEILGYRRVLTFVLNVATEPGFVADVATIKSMHFMLLEHDLAKSPGRYRTTDIYVRDDKSDQTVYEGPDPDSVPVLMDALAETLAAPGATEPMVRGAMAHLNLVMVHPFRDGNGRMARALQTLVFAQDDVLEPTFSSIEEWLGHNTEDYYRALAATGAGGWNPQRDAHLWVKFTLRAHHMQAQTLQRRFSEAERLWNVVDDLVAEHRLPSRTADILFDALLGLRVTRPSYVKRTGTEERTATRDLARLVESTLLRTHGHTRGRYYLAGDGLRAQARAIRADRSPLSDPYPDLMTEIGAIARSASAPAQATRARSSQATSSSRSSWTSAR
ncbi:MAG: Fic family protein [Dermatophilaceae bacterium]